MSHLSHPGVVGVRGRLRGVSLLFCPEPAFCSLIIRGPAYPREKAEFLCLTSFSENHTSDQGSASQTETRERVIQEKVMGGRGCWAEFPGKDTQYDDGISVRASQDQSWQRECQSLSLGHSHNKASIRVVCRVISGSGSSL